jgi:hypothetical protein
MPSRLFQGDSDLFHLSTPTAHKEKKERKKNPPRRRRVYPHSISMVPIGVIPSFERPPHLASPPKARTLSKDPFNTPPT